MKKNPAIKSKKRSSRQSGKSSSSSGRGAKGFIKSLRIIIIYLLALYGAHTLCGNFSPVYRNSSNQYIRQVLKLVSSGSETLRRWFSDHKSVIIRSRSDLQKSKYDNLKLGVPSFNCSVIIDRIGYAFGYSEEQEQPLWVSYKLTANEVKSQKARRTDDFRSDPYVPTASAAPEDYKGSFFDRGHLAPAADMKFSLQAMSESFYMSNMSPQRSEFNRGIWKDLEEKVRDYAVANQEIYVVTGPIFTPGKTNVTIGSNRVAVPDKYYKVVLDTTSTSPKAIGFILENKAAKKPLASYAVTVDEVEKATGLNFFDQLDPNDEKLLESQCDYQLWESNLPERKTFKRKK